MSPSFVSLPLPRPLRPWITLVSLWLVVMVVGAWSWGELARQNIRNELARQADASALLHASVLRSELEKYRALPPAMATDPDVIRSLQTRDTRLADNLNQRLEALSNRTRSAAIYVVSSDGLTVASSNWNTTGSFVGANYGFRPYFIRALQQGYAEFFALGTVSRKPGMYLAHRIVDASNRNLGVLVVKVEFDALENEWSKAGEPVYVVDPGGVVLVTSEPEWRFRTLGTLDSRSRQLTLADQTLGQEALTPLPFKTPASDTLRQVEAKVDGVRQTWMHASAPSASPGWTLHLLLSTRGAIEKSVSNARTLAALFITLTFAVAAFILRRRQQLVARQKAAETNRLELERRIEERTRDLREANLALNSQIQERIRAEDSREALRHELVQASKLAALGQIAAGVAHEINQPMAAIRTQAETATAYLEHGQPPKAIAALDRITALTARIGAITHELLSFSRKSEARLKPIDLNEAIDGALLLLGGALAQSAVRLERNTALSSAVLGDRFRLEQVIVNLMQNAIEALAGTRSPLISLKVDTASDDAILRICDNGSGIDPAIAEQLFTPFVTSKENGLGLGLVICRDIIASFGGELSHEPSEAGACFSISLKRA